MAPYRFERRWNGEARRHVVISHSVSASLAACDLIALRTNGSFYIMGIDRCLSPAKRAPQLPRETDTLACLCTTPYSLLAPCEVLSPEVFSKDCRRVNL